MPVKVSEMSLKEKLYQLIIQRLDGNKIHSGAYIDYIFDLVRKGIGGFILFSGQSEEIRDFIKKLQLCSEIPLFIASDIERGTGQQVFECTYFPCQMAVAAAVRRHMEEDEALLRIMVSAIANEAAYVGINMPLIPVLDVNFNPDNPIICTRAFSDNPETVSWFGSEYIKILEGKGLISCAKHFPGHGDTSRDSHIELPVISKSLSELMDKDLLPFKTAIREGAGSVMVGHIVLPGLDHLPASLSRKIIKELLREQLEFKGLVLTDALNMNALKGIENAAGMCINAGADILLHPENPELTVKELESALETGLISEHQIDEAINRILDAKQKIHPCAKDVINYRNHERLSFDITGKSITLVKNAAGVIPQKETENIPIVLAGDEQCFGACLFKDSFKQVYSLNDITEGHKLFTGKPLILPIFTTVSAWKGSSGIPESEKDKIINLIKESSHSIIISFGSPYVLRHFTEANVLIAAYEPSLQAQKAVINCITGKAEFKGSLPVRLQ